MASYTPLLFHRKPSQLYHHRGPGRDVEDDMVSLYSVADVTLPRIMPRDVRIRDVQLRKIERSNDSIPVSCVHLYSSPNIKEGDMSGPIVWEMRSAYKMLAGKYKDHLGDLHKDWKMVLKVDLKMQDMRVLHGFNWLRIESRRGLL
jgi:hypothetical protein